MKNSITKVRIVLAMLAGIMLAIAFSILASDAKGQPAQVTVTAPKQTPGQVVPFFPCGAGNILSVLGTNDQVRIDGWEYATRRTFTPKLMQFWAGRAPANARVIFHLPFGRSEVATGPLADMPFDGLDRAKEVGLTKVADTYQLSRSLRVIQLQFGCEVGVYLGTVDHGHEAQWSSMSVLEFAYTVDNQLAPFAGIPNFRLWLDAGAVMGTSSNSWQVRNAVARRGMKFGTEPWPPLDKGRCWADDAACDILVTHRAFTHTNDSWAIPRGEIKGRVIILADEPMSDARIVSLLRDGYDVAINCFDMPKTAAQWTAAISVIGE